MRATVLIVDDHDAFRSAARSMLEAGGFAVVGEVADGRTAISISELLAPDVVLLDIQLPDIDGFEVAQTLAGQPAPPLVVLTSSRSVSAYRRRLASTSACGFIPKEELSAAAVAALVG